MSAADPKSNPIFTAGYSPEQVRKGLTRYARGVQVVVDVVIGVVFRVAAEEDAHRDEHASQRQGTYVQWKHENPNRTSSIYGGPVTRFPAYRRPLLTGADR